MMLQLKDLKASVDDKSILNGLNLGKQLVKL